MPHHQVTRRTERLRLDRGAGLAWRRFLLPRTLADRHGTRRPWQRHRLPGVGVVLLADLNHVDRPRESRLVGVRRVATDDEHAPRGIEPALGVVVYVLAAHDSPLSLGRHRKRRDRTATV